MKTLYLVRHAKSSWKDASLKDFDRPLNKRGKHDVPLMGEVLKSMNICPSVLAASPAIRAKETAKALASTIAYAESKIVFEQKLYDGGEKNMIKFIKAQPENNESLMLIGHNPELTHLANSLSDSYIYNIPTMGIYAIKLKSWQQVGEEKGAFWFFEFPKKYYDEE